MRIYKYVQSPIGLIILQQHVSAITVTIIRVSYKNSTTIMVQKYIIKPLIVTLSFPYRVSWSLNIIIIIMFIFVKI